VILINLLPHREAKRRQRKRAFFVSLGLFAVAGAVAAGVWYSVLEELKSNQDGRNEFLKHEIATLDAQIKDIATLRAEIDALKARQKAVEDLQTDRNTPVHLLNELVKQTPEGIYLTAIKQTGQVVLVNGIAQTNERVSEYLRNTLYNSTWLERPELIEIKATTQGTHRLFEFSMRVTLKRLQTAVANAASAPASAARTAKAS